MVYIHFSQRDIVKPCFKNQRGEGEGGKGDGDESGEYGEKL